MSMQAVGKVIVAQGSIRNNPADGAVLADTGPLLAGNYLISVTGSGSTDWCYDLQVGSRYLFRRRPNIGNEDFLPGFKFAIHQNERVLAVLRGEIIGEVQMSIIVGEAV